MTVITDLIDSLFGAFGDIGGHIATFFQNVFGTIGDLSSGSSAPEAPVDPEVPGDDVPGDDTPVDETPGDDVPADETPVDPEVPGEDAPIEETPEA